ncbi:MAG: DMT family transporter [Anaerolineales bacterium]|nr:DMT family transporter [Anaerolineales bacterium]
MTERDVPTARPARPWPLIGLLFGILGMGCSAIFVRWAGAPGAVSGFYRMALAVVVFGLPFAVSVRHQPVRSRRAKWMAVLAGLCFAADLSLWNQSVLMTSAANATFLGNTAPLWVGLATWLLLKQPLKRGYWIGLAVALGGAFVLVAGDFSLGGQAGLGGLFSLIAGVFYAGYFLATQQARVGMSALTSWWLSALASLTALLAVALVFGQSLVGYAPQTYVWMLAVGLFTQIGGYLLVNYALGHLPASIVSIVLLLQPIVTLALAVPLLGEYPDSQQVVGGVLLLLGVWIVNRYGH